MRFVALVLLATLSFAQELRLGDALTSPDQLKTPPNRHAEPSAAIPATWYDTSNRAAIAAAYRDDFLPTRLTNMGWTGNITTGDAGTTTDAYKSAVAQRVNWFRAMAGVPAWVTFDSTFSSKAQKGALMLGANSALSHNPPSNWLWFTAEGAEALGKSNICAGFGYDPGCVSQFMSDQGTNNAAVGHRRWILYPQTRQMGTGDVFAGGNLWNALWVFDANFGTTRPTTREEYVAWPPKGYVPYQVTFPRWSFSYRGADFSAATVSLTRNGSAVAVTVEPLSSNIGENTIVWVPAGQSSVGNIPPTPPSADEVWTVTVNNVSIAGTPRNFTYQVIVFDPAAGNVYGLSPMDTLYPVAGGTSPTVFTVKDPPTAPGPSPVSNASWITITSKGGNFFIYSVAANAGPARTSSISFGPVSHTVSQAGSAGGCSFTLSQNGTTVDANAASGTFTLTASASNCAWTASSDRSWLQVFPLNGTGNATISYTVAPNFSAANRNGVLTVGAMPFNVSQQAGTGTTTERFVRLVYFNFFGRLPSAAEVAFQSGAAANRAQFALSFLNSAEFNNGGRFVAGLYTGLLNRDAEYGGWVFQRNALVGGFTTPDVIVNSFINGAEFVGKYGTLSNSAFVTLMYQQILGRTPSADDLNFQTGVLNAGGSRVVLARAFLNTTEFRQGKNARLLAFLLYSTLLNRGPLTAEFNLRRDQITANSSDATLQALMGEIVATSEFLAQFN